MGNYQQNIPNPAPSHTMPNTVNPISSNAPEEGSPAWVSGLICNLSPQQRMEVDHAYETWKFDRERRIIVVRMYHEWFELGLSPKKEELLRFYRAKRASSQDASRPRGGKGGQGTRGGAIGYTCEWPGCGQTLGGRTDRVHEHALNHLHIKAFICSAVEWYAPLQFFP